MTIQVQAPDGSTIDFPDTASADQIHKIMTSRFKPPPAPTADATPPAPGTLRPTREVPPPGPGQSFSDLSRNVSQRARNTAFGEGPGSVSGIPGVALAPASEGAGVVASGAAKVWGALPTWLRTGIASGAIGLTADTARKAGAPESLVKWLENMELVRQFGGHP